MISRTLVSLASVVSTLVTTACVVIDVQSPAMRNETTAVHALYHVEAVTGGCCVTGIRLNNGSMLLPDQPMTREGYVFSLAVDGPNYAIYATPEKRGATGYRAFFADRAGTIRHSLRARATAEDPTLRGAPSPDR
jgi:hypothetical protein